MVWARSGNEVAAMTDPWTPVSVHPIATGFWDDRGNWDDDAIWADDALWVTEDG